MIKHLREQYPEFVIIDEPVDQWIGMKDAEGNSLLSLFYQDQKRWSYTFQNAAFITRYLSAYEALMKPVDKDTIYISERGILTDRYVFATMLRKDGLLSDIEWELYTRWFDRFKHLINVHGIVYITTDSTLCSSRIKTRGRSEETNIPQAYLDDLEHHHELWLSSSTVPVLRISSDRENVQKIVEFAHSLM